MIISEVLDAIDNVNSITLESEIDTCESLLSSYDKMSIIIESCENDNLDDFKIIQEGKNFDKFKEEFNKQNEGKSTLNKIIFAIPRIIMSLIRLILSKFKKNEEVIEKIDEPLKDKKNGGAVAAALISAGASILINAASLYFTFKAIHVQLKEVNSMEHGDETATEWLKKELKLDFPNVYKKISEIKAKIDWLRLRNILKKAHKPMSKKEIEKPETKELVESMNSDHYKILFKECFSYDKPNLQRYLKNVLYNKLINNDKATPLSRHAAISEYKTIAEDLIKSEEYAVNYVKKCADEDYENASDTPQGNLQKEAIDYCRENFITSIEKTLQDDRAQLSKVSSIEKNIAKQNNDMLEVIKKNNKIFADNIVTVNAISKKRSSKSKFVDDFLPDPNDGCWCIKYNITRVIDGLIAFIKDISDKIDKLNGRKQFNDNIDKTTKNQDSYKTDKEFVATKATITNSIYKDIIALGDSKQPVPFKTISRDVYNNKHKYEDILDKFQSKLKENTAVISDDEQKKILEYVEDHGKLIRTWCTCYDATIKRIPYLNYIIEVEEIKEIIKSEKNDKKVINL